MFTTAYFIKPGEAFDPSFTPDKNPCSVFYKEFNLDTLPSSATLSFCALGIGYAYLNGARVSEDLFAPPSSNYEKSLWYMSYDLTRNLRKGKNTLAFICGNGFLNEDMKNAWQSERAEWRDRPKLICELEADGRTVLATDESWLCSTSTPYLMNRYRQGVLYDSRLPMPDSPDFTAYGFDRAVRDDRAPKGIFRLCDCEPIRENEILEPIAVTALDDRTRVYDFGFNSSGYVRLTACGKSGQVIKIRYAEEANPDGTLKLNNIDDPHFYPEGEFMTERFICCGKPTEWSTMMSYYGFRYAEITSDEPEAVISVKGVFVHQAVKRTGFFECSDPFLNKLFECGIRATKSNLFYMPTDCPTREKYGWLNDAQSSAEQILTDFSAEKLLSRWVVDVCDALDDEKGLPGIVPTHGWGFHWGNGPVSDGSLFEQPYRIFLHTGDRKPLVYALPYFRRYFAFARTREDENGFLPFGLYDWANPHGNAENTPRQLINEIYRCKFYRIAALAARLANEDPEEFLKGADESREKVIKRYLNADGTCKINEQTAVAMLIYHGIYKTAKLSPERNDPSPKKNLHITTQWREDPSPLGGGTAEQSEAGVEAKNHITTQWREDPSPLGENAEQARLRFALQSSGGLVSAGNEDGGGHTNNTPFEALSSQLKALVEENGFRHDCGMVGLRHLYMALSECGLQEYAMRIITASEYPCYRRWINEGATTLWEKWDKEESKNHQMYSDVISYLIKTAGGICPDESEPVYKSVTVDPYYFEHLSFANARVVTVNGEVGVRWRREDGVITLSITAPCDNLVSYKGETLPKGETVFTVKA